MNWYVRGRTYAIQFCIYSMLALSILYRKRYLGESVSKNLICLGILMLAMANALSGVPSMGRFFSIAAFILIAGFIFLIQSQSHNKIFKFLGYAYLTPILIFIIVEIRIGFDFIGLNTLFLNPLIAPFFPDSPALIEFFK